MSFAADPTFCAHGTGCAKTAVRASPEVCTYIVWLTSLVFDGIAILSMFGFSLDNIVDSSCFCLERRETSTMADDTPIIELAVLSGTHQSCTFCGSRWIHEGIMLSR